MATTDEKISRRAALQRTMTVGAAASMAWNIPLASRGSGPVAPSERINLGVIGIGPRARHVLQGMLPQPDCQCIAICDVQDSRRKAGKQIVDAHYGNRDCAVHRDFRELLARPDIDAVLIATGDRWHAPASMLAAEAGKDIYSEKPCGLTIGLCQELDDTIRRTGRIFQAGTQRRSVPNFQRAVDMAQAGELGKLHTLYATVYIPDIRTQWLPSEPTPDPGVVDWNLWLGPAPWRPYNKAYVEGDWRRFWDFDSGGALLDWGAHTVDLCQWANLADGTAPVEYVPSDKNITCRYENGLTLVLDFLETPFGERGPNWITRLGTCPVRFEGSQGSVETGDNGEMVIKLEGMSPQSVRPEQGISGLDVALHARNFFDSIKSRKPAVCNSSVMRSSHIACHAAALSWVLGRTLRFDPQKEQFVNDSEANGLRNRPARDYSIVV